MSVMIRFDKKNRLRNIIERPTFILMSNYRRKPPPVRSIVLFDALTFSFSFCLILWVTHLPLRAECATYVRLNTSSIRFDHVHSCRARFSSLLVVAFRSSDYPIEPAAILNAQSCPQFECFLASHRHRHLCHFIVIQSINRNQFDSDSWNHTTKHIYTCIYKVRERRATWKRWSEIQFKLHMLQTGQRRQEGLFNLIEG